MYAALQPGPPGRQRLVGTVDLQREAVDSTRGPAFRRRRGRVTILQPVLARVRGERAAEAFGRRRVRRGGERPAGRRCRMEHGQPGHGEEQGQRQQPGACETQPIPDRLIPPRVPSPCVVASHRTAHFSPDAGACAGLHMRPDAPMVLEEQATEPESLGQTSPSAKVELDIGRMTEPKCPHARVPVSLGCLRMPVGGWRDARSAWWCRSRGCGRRTVRRAGKAWSGRSTRERPAGTSRARSAAVRWSWCAPG